MLLKKKQGLPLKSRSRREVNNLCRATEIKRQSLKGFEKFKFSTTLWWKKLNAYTVLSAFPYTHDHLYRYAGFDIHVLKLNEL